MQRNTYFEIRKQERMSIQFSRFPPVLYPIKFFKLYIKW